MTAAAEYKQVAKQSDQPKTVAQLLKVLTPEIARALPKGMDADRLARIVSTEIRKSRNAKMAGTAKHSLEECTFESIAGALLTASALGLEPGIMAEAYLIPYRDNARRVVECQLVIGYQGIVKLFWQHPRAEFIDTQVVYERDEFRYSKGLNPVLEHTPFPGDIDERGEVVAYYAIAKAKDAAAIWDVFTPKQIGRLRNGKVGPSGNIADPQRWMERKTALKQVLKLAPKTTRLDMALRSDENDGSQLYRSQGMPLPAGTGLGAEHESDDAGGDYIEGDVLPPPESADDVPLPPEPAAAPAADVKMASRQQITQLKQIRQAEKYDADADWYGYLADAFSISVSADTALTYEQAKQIIGAFGAGL